MKKKIGIAVIVIAALALALFSQRVLVMDALRNLEKQDLPEAVSFEDVKTQAEDRQREDVSGTEISIDPILEEETEQEESEVVEEVEESDADDAVSEHTPEDESLPASFNLAVPFTSQAPNADWSLPYQEACEEASLIMVHAYYTHEPAGKLPASVAEEAIQSLVEFQNGIFGDYLDTTAQQTATIAEQFYGYSRAEVIENPTAQDIKAHIAAGRPVIIPAAGQQLGNPNFTPPGPLYHMLVVRGYTADGFITNDPGTRNGESYFYKTSTLMNAIHDWNGGDVANGGKVILVIYPEN